MSESKTVVMFSTADWNAPYWTNKQHIASRLARRGFRVLYVESPGIRAPKGNSRDLARVWNRLRSGLRPPRKVDKNIFVLSPMTIPLGHRFGLIKAFNGWMLRSTVKAWLHRHGDGKTIVWAYHPYLDGVLKKLSYKRLVYHCVDDIAAVPGVDAEAYLTAEIRLVDAADVVFTTSPFLKEHCEKLGARNCVFERNVADIEHFSRSRQPGEEPKDIKGIGRPRLCYAGVLSDYKIDADLITECATSRPDINWIFIGDEPERQNSKKIRALSLLPNVHMLGFRPYSELPDYLRFMDITVLPNRTDGYMKGVFPMKFYEYLASGKPVIASRLDSLADVSGPFLTATSPQEWLNAIDRCLSSQPEMLALDDPLLSEYSWESRLDRMLEKIDGKQDKGRPN